MTKEEVLDLFKKSYSKADVCRALEIPTTNIRKINSLIKKYNIDISHFDNKLRSSRKYKRIIKNCPVCDKEFETKLGNSEEKTTCSHSCANTHFRSGPDNPNWKDERYQSTCFHYHEKKCIICDEENIVEVHHFDENHDNHSIENLMPLCPTHHKYWHSRFKHLVEDKVIKYRKDFILYTLPEIKIK